MKAIDIDWSKVKRFSPSEWPEGVLEHMDGSVITALSMLRDSLPAGHSMRPSPLARAHVRASGSSRHSIEGGRLADATDVFMDWDTIMDAWLVALRLGEIGGVGLYFDTHLNHKPTPMLHIDTRPGVKLTWVRADGVYHYFHKNPVDFFEVVAEAYQEHKNG